MLRVGCVDSVGFTQLTEGEGERAKESGRERRRRREGGRFVLFRCVVYCCIIDIAAAQQLIAHTRTRTRTIGVRDSDSETELVLSCNAMRRGHCASATTRRDISRSSRNSRPQGMLTGRYSMVGQLQRRERERDRESRGGSNWKLNQ